MKNSAISLGRNKPKKKYLLPSIQLPFDLLKLGPENACVWIRNRYLPLKYPWVVVYKKQNRWVKSFSAFVNLFNNTLSVNKYFFKLKKKLHFISNTSEKVPMKPMYSTFLHYSLNYSEFVASENSYISNIKQLIFFNEKFTCIDLKLRCFIFYALCFVSTNNKASLKNGLYVYMDKQMLVTCLKNADPVLKELIQELNKLDFYAFKI